MPIHSSEEWIKLQEYQKELKGCSLSELVTHNYDTGNEFSLDVGPLHLDFSKNFINEKIFHKLVALAESNKLRKHINDMRQGNTVNVTENRPALHMLLRSSHSQAKQCPEIQLQLDKMESFSQACIEKRRLGATGKALTDIVNIGIGGSHLGPLMVVEALKPYDQGLHCHFVSNIDPTDMVGTLSDLNPETTLFLISSKTFTTQETLANADMGKAWLQSALGPAAIQQHFVAITANPERALAYGIDGELIFKFWDYIGGRFSLWSAIGLSIALSIGYYNFEKMLKGAETIDSHFCTAVFEQNLPVIMALLGIWYQNFWGADSHAIIPYSQSLLHLVPYLQQLEMESNGKHVNCQGNPLPYNTSPIIWGGVGSNGQHAYHQLLLQGTHFVPVDFILPLTSHCDATQHQTWLVSHCLAQARALMVGRKASSIQDNDPVTPHKVIKGNIPSNLIAFDKLGPTQLGALIALYEHKVFSEAALLDINPFDQWGVETGKQIATEIHTAFTQEQTPRFDPSTNALVRRYQKILASAE